MIETLITCIPIFRDKDVFGIDKLIAFESNVRDVSLGDKNMTCTYHMRTIDILYF